MRDTSVTKTLMVAGLGVLTASAFACGPEPTPRPPTPPVTASATRSASSEPAQQRPAVRVATLGSQGFRHSARVADLVVAGNGRSLVTRVAAVRAAKLTAVALWATSTQDRRLQRIGTAFAYLKGGAQIALEQSRGRAALLNAASGAIETKLRDTGARIGVMAAPADGRWLATGDEQGVVRVWPLAAGGKIEPVERSRSNGKVLALAASTDGARLAAAWEGYVEVLSTEAEDGRGSLVVHVPGLKAASAVLQLSSDASRLLVSNVNPATEQRAKSQAKIYDLPGGSMLRELSKLHDALLFPAGDKVLVSRKAGQVAIVDPKKGRDIKRLNLGVPATAAIAVGPAGKVLAAAAGNQLKIWDGAGAELHHFELDELASSRLAFGPKGMLLYLAHGQAVRVWDLEKGAERRVATGHVAAVRAVALSTDGQIAVTGGDDATVRFWDANKGSQLAVLGGHGAPVGAVAYAPGGERAASASYDGIVRIWDVSKRRLLHDLVGHQRTWPVDALAFSSDAARLASGGAYSEAKIWDVATGSLLQSIDWRIGGAKPSCGGKASCGAVAMETTRVHTLRFLGQEQLLSVSLAGVVELWDIASAKRVRQLAELGEMVATSFSADGSVMLAVTRDRKLHRLSLPEGSLTSRTLAKAPRASGIALVSQGFATAHVDGRLRLWTLGDGVALGTSDPRAIVETRAGAALALAAGVDGRKLLVGQQNSSATLWRLR